MTDQSCALCAAPSARTLDDRPLCESCAEKAEAYQDRLESRLARLQHAAMKAQQEGNSAYQQARSMASAIPFGQPILVGHHSEGRDRRYRDRIHGKFGRAFAHMERAEKLTERARAAEKNTVIRSDDPLAIVKLQDEIGALETKQTWMREVNKVIRKNLKKPVEEQIAALVALDMSEAQAKHLLEPDFLKRIGYPDYALTNNGSNIRRLKERLTELETKAQQASAPDFVSEETHGDIRLTRDAEDNRLRLYFPGKPTADAIKTLKANGFIWSPTNTAWQRQLNNGAEYAATRVLKEIGHLYGVKA